MFRTWEMEFSLYIARASGIIDHCGISARYTGAMVCERIAGGHVYIQHEGTSCTVEGMYHMYEYHEWSELDNNSGNVLFL